MSKRERTWLGVFTSVIALQTLVTFSVPRAHVFHLPFGISFGGNQFRVTFGDILQNSLIAFAVVVLVRLARRSQGPSRLFWSLMATGLSLWLSDLLFWTYYEVIRGVSVPPFTIGDTLLFLHLVPMVAAIGIRPDLPPPTEKPQRKSLDFAILVIYWLYFYALFVMPYEFVRPDVPSYDFNFDLVDKLGHTVLMVSLGVVFLRSRGAWRRIYLMFTVASLAYAVFSDVANLAIDQNTYYSGAPVDILLVSTMCAFAFISLEARWLTENHIETQPVSEAEPRRRILPWTALVGMIVTLSTPVIGFVLVAYAQKMDPAVREFRLVITMVAMFLLFFLVFLKQTLLQRDVVYSLSNVSAAFSDLQRVKNQLVQTEKLASMGRLLAGAAHEINNPLTAILGYSDLLTSSTNEPQARSMGEKIAQQARRTKMLVEDLLKFSQETPTQRSSNDIHVLVRNAIKIANLDSTNPVTIEVSSRDGLPPVVVDPGQILQVFVHLIRNAAEAMRDSSVRKLQISTRSGNDQVQIEFADSGSGVKDPNLVFDPFYTTKSPGKGTGLGLSACYGIVQKHGGQITCQNRPQGGAVFTVTLPTIEQPQMQNA